MGEPMLMGRTTFESFGAPLAGRRRHPGADARSRLAGRGERSPSPAPKPPLRRRAMWTRWRWSAERRSMRCCGRADRIEPTEVHAEPEGDTWVPAFDAGWRETFREDHAAEGDRPAYSFVTLVRGS